MRDAYLQRRQGMVEDDDAPAPAPGKNARGELLPLAVKGAIMPVPAVPAGLWFDTANQRADQRADAARAAAKPGAPTDNATRRGAKSASAGGASKSL